MIYLMKDRNIVKIGYAINPEERLKSFQTGNCFITLEESKTGTLHDEHELHRLCNQ